MSSIRPVRLLSTSVSCAMTHGCGVTMMFDTTPASASVRGKSRAMAENGTKILSLSGPL